MKSGLSISHPEKNAVILGFEKIISRDCVMIVLSARSVSTIYMYVGAVMKIFPVSVMHICLGLYIASLSMPCSARIVIAPDTVPYNVKPIRVIMSGIVVNKTYATWVKSGIHHPKGYISHYMRMLGIKDDRVIINAEFSPAAWKEILEKNCDYLSSDVNAIAFVRPARQISHYEGRDHIVRSEYPVYYVDSLKISDLKKCRSLRRK